MLKTLPNSRRLLRHAIGLLMIVGMLAPSQPVFAATERQAQVRMYDQVFHFIEEVKGKATAHRYTLLIVNAAKKHALHPMLVANLILNESSFNPKAVSPVGAIGLMQVMPFHYTHRRIPIAKWHDPALNIDLGCEILASYIAMMNKRYPGLSPSALQHRALVAYNMGPRAVVSRGIYRSRYSQKVFQEGGLVAAVPRPAPPVPAPPPAALPEARPEDAEPLSWEQLPLSSSALSVGYGEGAGDRLRIGYPLPETVFLGPRGAAKFLPRAGIEQGTP